MGDAVKTSGLARYMRILQLFTETNSSWTITEIAAALAAPPSTIYRIVRELLGADLLESANEAQYRIGPACIEYDRLIRVTDPLYVAGVPVLQEAVVQARLPCVAVLARLYNGTVMCIADAATPYATIKTSYERGRPRPLTRGATSKAILAQLPARKLAKLLAPEFAADVAAQTTLRNTLAAIRKRGFSVTAGEVDAGLTGIAAPISIPARGLVGSVSLVVEASAVDPSTERRLGMLVMSAAALLCEELNPVGHHGCRPAKESRPR